MGTPEFPNLGEHCSVHDCHLIDFLPFRCDSCNQVFCLEHRSYSKHQCPSGTADVTVLVCPLCAKSFRLIPTEDPNVTWEKHVGTDCDPSNYEKVRKKPRCPVPGCREQLTFSNKVTCRNCKQDVCLKHRFSQDHQCKVQGKGHAEDSSFTNNILRRFKDRTAAIAAQNSRSSGSSTEGLRSGFQSAALSIKTSAEAGMNKFSTLTNNMFNAVAGRVNKGQEHKVHMAEICPQCGTGFSTVSQLIQHVEDSHCAVGDAKEQLLDVCPKCGRKFRDPIALVNHVETDHGGSSAY